jgi:hypothetical protein
MNDDNEYPTEKDLLYIQDFDNTKDDICDLIRYVHNIWWMPDWGFKYDSETMDLELHTGGWSGNESIISALQKNKHLFWFWYWQKSLRGGHYWFNLDMYDKLKRHADMRDRIS